MIKRRVPQYTFSTLIVLIESSFSTKDAEKHMASAIDAANEAVFNESANNPDYRGMGTTLVAAGVFEDYACVANIGDSRAYLISPKYGIKQITIGGGLLPLNTLYPRNTLYPSDVSQVINVLNEYIERGTSKVIKGNTSDTIK